MRALIIDNTMDENSWGAREIREILHRVSPGLEIHVRRAPLQDLPREPKGFDRIVLTGSRASCLAEEPWIENLDFFLKRSLDSKKPILGVCYGHQALVRVLGGRQSLRLSERPEYGWTLLEQTRPNRLLNGLPREFYSFSSHIEEAASLPPGLELFVKSEACAIQGFESSTAPVFGIQFHPEKTLTSEQETISGLKKKGLLKWYGGLGKGKRLYDPKIGDTVFLNFIRLESA